MKIFNEHSRLWHFLSFSKSAGAVAAGKFHRPEWGKVAVVGDNGCGKTTLMRLYLCCMLISNQMILK
jgi:ABC-type cobalamin/Fe3+-siderophores transport system ATPase subunit